MGVQATTLAGSWGENNILVPGAPDAVAVRAGTAGQRGSLCIVEPYGTLVVICVELEAEESSGYLLENLEDEDKEVEKMVARVWYEVMDDQETRADTAYFWNATGLEWTQENGLVLSQSPVEGMEVSQVQKMAICDHCADTEALDNLAQLGHLQPQSLG